MVLDHQDIPRCNHSQDDHFREHLGTTVSHAGRGAGCRHVHLCYDLQFQKLFWTEEPRPEVPQLAFSGVIGLSPEVVKWSPVDQSYGWSADWAGRRLWCLHLRLSTRCLGRKSTTEPCHAPRRSSVSCWAGRLLEISNHTEKTILRPELRQSFVKISSTTPTFFPGRPLVVCERWKSKIHGEIHVE